MKMKRKRIGRPGRTLIFGFLAIIFAGGLLLSCPFTHNKPAGISLPDALFVATSAVCVTGLTPVDIAATFNVAGRTIIAVLIQLGGLGFASIAIFFLTIFGKTIGAGQRSLLKEALNSESNRGLVGIVQVLMAGSAIVELVGAASLYRIFSRTYRPAEAIGMSLFHSISAFNNAGFDLLGNFSSLTGYQDDAGMNITISLLIILGGLGFFVYQDILLMIRRKKRLSTHSKIVLSMSGILIAVGMLLFMATDGLSPMEAWFQSITARTAGFNTVDMASLSTAGLLVMTMLMFIGASPASTGGGIKTTTLMTLFVMVLSLPAHRQPTAFRRKISTESILKALVVVTMAASAVLLGTFALAMLEGDRFPLSHLLFESVSAFATVGLTCNVTPHLGTLSKLILMALMFLGRLGPLTIASSFRFKEQNLSYVEEKILIG